MLLEVSGLDVRYGRTHAVKRADLTVDAGEIVTVLGANGAGKTSLLRALQGAVRPSGWRVVFERTAHAYEEGCETAREEFARKSRVVAGAVQFLSRADSAVPLSAPQVIESMLSHKALRWLSPAFAAATLLASAVLAGTSPGYAAALALQCGLSVVGAAGCAPGLRRWSLVAGAHYFCLVQVAAAVGVARGIMRRQPVLWRRFARASSAQPLRVSN